MKVLLILIVTLGAFAARSAAKNGTQQCNANEKFDSCNGCDQFCNSEPIACKQDCSSPGCYCEKDFVRKFKGGPCISRRECPSQNGKGAQGPESSSKQNKRNECSKHEIYRECGNCEQICNQKPIACTKECKPAGCYCKEGYVRSSEGHCISESSCKGAQGPESSSKQDAGKGAQGPKSPPIQNTGSQSQAGSSAISRSSGSWSQSSSSAIAQSSGRRSQTGNSAVAQSKAAECPANEVYQYCGVGSQCENYCGRGPNACAYCEDGCYCQKDYIRSNSNYKSECIPANQCPPQCGQNEVYQPCNGCDQVCNREPIFCTQDCRNPGCYCQRGYVRLYPGGECVQPGKCPRRQSSPVVQNAGTRSQSGSSAYSQSSGSQSQAESTAMSSNSGRRSQADSSAVAQSGAPRCAANEVYKYCGVGSQCENYCGRGPDACAYCEDGCYCKKDYIRANSGYKSKCIPANQCPPQCGKNEVYNPCNGCDQVCNREPIFCTQDCSSPGCYCRKNHVRLYPGGDCVQPERCPRAMNSSSSSIENSGPGSPSKGPSNTQTSGRKLKCNRPNEEYQCGSACQTTCKNLGKPCDRVNIRCNDACYCIKGYARATNGTCIDQKQC